MRKKKEIHFFFRIGSVSVILGAVTVLGAITSIILGRYLTPEDFGHFGLFRTCILFVAPVSLLGQDIAAVRFFSKNGLENFRWKKKFSLIMLICMMVTLVAVIVIRFIYDFTIPLLTLLLPTIIFFAMTIYLANLLRSQGKYTQAVLLLNGYKAVFLVSVLALYFTARLSLHFTMSAFVFAVIINGLILLILVFFKVKEGMEAIPSILQKSGLLFLGFHLCVHLFASLDVFVLSHYLDFASVGIYMATLVPTQIFMVIAKSAKFVWIPEYSKSNSTMFFKGNLFIFLGAIALFVLYCFFAHDIMFFLYKDKYSGVEMLVRILAAASLMRLFYNLGSSVIVGRLSFKAMQMHLIMNVLAIIVYLVFLYFGINRWQVTGAAFALLAIMILRSLFTMIIIRYFSQTQNNDDLDALPIS